MKLGWGGWGTTRGARGCSTITLHAAHDPFCFSLMSASDTLDRLQLPTLLERKRTGPCPVLCTHVTHDGEEFL